MTLIKNIFILLAFIFISCKGSDKQHTLVNKGTVLVETLKVQNNYERKKNELAFNFINRILKNPNLNHQIIETDKWIDGVNIIIVFINKELEDDLGVEVEGLLYISKDKKRYKKIIIDTFGPEGKNANIESVFFTNTDTDPNKELIVLCSWVQQLKEIAEGKLYQTFIYNNFDLEGKQDKLTYLEDISNHFGIEFDGIQDGENVNAKYKTSEDIDKELTKLWGTTPTHPRKGRLSKQVSRAVNNTPMTLIVPYRPHLMWWRDIEDHVVADPIPMPVKNSSLYMVVRLGSRADSREYRKDLRKRDLEKIKKDVFMKFRGVSPAACLKYAMMLNTLAELAELDETPSDSYKPSDLSKKRDSEMSIPIDSSIYPDERRRQEEC